MGCDIHLCVERRRINKGWFVCNKTNLDSGKLEKVFKQVITEPTEWSPCLITQDETWSYRSYGMFAKLADVRNYWDIKPISIKGFPEDACLRTYCEYTLRVVPNENFSIHDDRTIPESRAEDWVKDGSSYEITVPNAPSHWGTRKFITNPDYHSPNWCSLKELEDAVKEIFFKEEIGEYVNGSEEWLALIGYMKGLETAGFETRCVFWFDN